MFSTLRQEARLFIFDKNKLQLKTGSVVSIKASQPKTGSYITDPNKAAIDVTVRVDNETFELQRIPISFSVADIGDIIVSDTEDLMFSSIEKFMKDHQKAIDNYEYSKKVVATCPGVLASLNKDYAKDVERDEAISEIKTEISTLKDEFRCTISEIKSLLQVHLNAENKNTNGKYENSSNNRTR